MKEVPRVLGPCPSSTLNQREWVTGPHVADESAPRLLALHPSPSERTTHGPATQQAVPCLCRCCSLCWDSPGCLINGTNFSSPLRMNFLQEAPLTRRAGYLTTSPSVALSACFHSVTHLPPTGRCPIALRHPSRSQCAYRRGPSARAYLVGWAEAEAEGSGRVGRVACWGVQGRAGSPENGSGRTVAAAVAQAPSVG